MISPTDQQVHCWAWLKNRLPDDSSLTMEDVTWKYTGKKSLKADLRMQPEITSGVSCCVPVDCLKCLEWWLGLPSKQLDENSNSETSLEQAVSWETAFLSYGLSGRVNDSFLFLNVNIPVISINTKTVEIGACRYAC